MIRDKNHCLGVTQSFLKKFFFAYGGGLVHVGKFGLILDTTLCDKVGR